MSGNPGAVDPPPPPVYNGRYELSQQIARGGTAQVYRARDLLLDRPVALKVLFPELSTESSFVERFRREAQAAANLSHPNIVPIFDWGESDRTYFIVMEYVDGEPLSAVIRRNAPLPPVRAASIAADIASALSFAHRRGVVHRDVKPGNVLITRDGLVKVADFGIARAIGADDNVTQTGLVMGTATYFSPEQAQGLGVDGRSDVYSLGCVLYEMVTGKPPFSADTPVAIAYKHVSEAPVPPRDIEPTVPEALEAIILQAMAKTPADRYATAEAMHADLARFAQGMPVHAVAPAFLSGAAFGATATQVLAQSPTTVLPAAAGSAAAATAIQQRTEVAGEPGGPGAPPPMPRRRWIPWAIAGVLLLVALALLIYYGGRQLGYFGASGYVRVPPVTGYSLGDAETTLHQDGLKYRAVPEYSAKRTGSVIGTRPGEGTEVKPGSTVTLFWSEGQQSIAVPNVINENYVNALQTIDSKFHGVLVPTPPTSSSDQINSVFKTDPAPGVKARPGSTVRIYYWSTPTVPTGIIGRPLQYVLNKLAAAHLTVGTTTQQVSATIPKNDVISTSPPPGSPVSPGQSVNIVVSEGSGTQVPNVLGQTKQQAESQLSSKGFNPNVQLQPGPASKENTVLSQNPSGGASAARGSTVTIVVDEGNIKISPPHLPNAQVNSPYNQMLNASGGTGSYTFSLSSGNLPPGINLGSNGSLTGSPNKPGHYSFTVTATDSDSYTGSRTYTLIVNGSTGPGPTGTGGGPGPGGPGGPGPSSGPALLSGEGSPPPTRES